jgi:hypothetical protein
MVKRFHQQQASHHTRPGDVPPALQVEPHIT